MMPIDYEEDQEPRDASDFKHLPPTEFDEYCNDCGLHQEFWGKVPICPARTPEGQQ